MRFDADGRMPEHRIEDYTLDNDQFDQTLYRRNGDQYMAGSEHALLAPSPDEE